VSKFKVGDRVRLTGRLWADNFDGDDTPRSGDIVVIREDDAFLHAGEEWYVGDNGWEAELLSHAPVSLDDVRNEEWNQSQEVRRAKPENARTVVDRDAYEEANAPSDPLAIEEIRGLLNHRTLFEESVDSVFSEMRSILLAKNRAYGNSALEPVRIFSKAGATEQLKVRIDDKLSRLMKGNDFADEDTITDLLGYLVLYKIASKQ